jgi:hypothetical protein
MTRSPLFEIATVLVRLDHVARFIVNANHGIMSVKLVAGRGSVLICPFTRAICEPCSKHKWEEICLKDY